MGRFAKMVLAGGIALLAGQAAQASTYSAVGDFSLGSNPNGVFSYLYSGTLLPNAVSTCVVSGVECWSTGEPIPNSISVAKNTTGSTIDYETIVLPPDQLALDPESQSVAVRFTAPSAGSYTIAGDFSGIDTGENAHLALINVGGVTVASYDITTYGQVEPFSLLETLTAGEVVDFAVLTGSSGCTYCNLSTGLAATISAVPEPGALALLGVGVLGLGAVRLRRRG